MSLWVIAIIMLAAVVALIAAFYVGRLYERHSQNKLEYLSQGYGLYPEKETQKASSPPAHTSEDSSR